MSQSKLSYAFGLVLVIVLSKLYLIFERWRKQLFWPGRRNGVSPGRTQGVTKYPIAPKEVSDELFKHSRPTVQELNREGRRLHRLKVRREWKEKNRKIDFTP